jgi:hypothetical protein
MYAQPSIQRILYCTSSSLNVTHKAYYFFNFNIDNMAEPAEQADISLEQHIQISNTQ